MIKIFRVVLLIGVLVGYMVMVDLMAPYDSYAPVTFEP